MLDICPMKAWGHEGKHVRRVASGEGILIKYVTMIAVAALAVLVASLVSAEHNPFKRFVIP